MQSVQRYSCFRNWPVNQEYQEYVEECLKALRVILLLGKMSIFQFEFEVHLSNGYTRLDLSIGLL